MTGPTDPAVAAVIGVLGRAYAEGAEPHWTALAILDALKRLGWRPTNAEPAPDWRHGNSPPAPPTPEYLLARPPSREPHT